MSLLCLNYLLWRLSQLLALLFWVSYLCRRTLTFLGTGHGAGNFSQNWFAGSSTNLGNYALALYSGLWAYDGIAVCPSPLIAGWDNVNYVTAEMKNPSRDLSRVIHSAEPLVIRTRQTTVRELISVAYLAANIGYFAVLPMNIITSSETIALVRSLRNDANCRILVLLCSGPLVVLFLRFASRHLVLEHLMQRRSRLRD